MTQVMMPYILPLLLGRTINLDTMEIGVDIFPKSVIENPTILNNPVTETHYKIVDNTEDSRKLLDVDGSFSLNVKAGIFKAGADGAYLSDVYNKENTVEVAIRATYQMVTEQLPSDAKPFPMWQQLGALGTHFVRSITYGGELIGAVRMVCNNTRDKQRIKAGLEVGGKIKVFDLSVSVEGEYMKDVSKSVESTQIKVFSAVPLSQTPNDMETLKETLKNFPADVNHFNKGRGIPIKMELWPLSLLDSSRPAKIRDRALEANLDSFEQKFDDLLNTKAAISDWMKIMTRPLTQDQEKKIGDLCAEVQKTLRPFYTVIGSLDMTKNSDQLKPAEEAYGSSIPGAYYKKYLLLRQGVTRDQGEWTRSRGNGATYTHWGKTNCSTLAEKLSEGHVIGPPSHGGGSNFLCLPESANLGDASSNREEATILQDTSYQFPNGKISTLLCSSCRLGARGAVQTFIGRTECPENWDFLYDGILMSGSLDITSTKFICLDRKTDNGQEVKSANPLLPDWATGADDKTQLLFTCVVCAK